VALTVLDTINTPAFLARVKEASVNTIAMLQGLITDYPQVFSVVRGSGLLLGLVVSDAWKGRAKDIQKAAEAQGLMVLIAGMDVVRLAPAFKGRAKDITKAAEALGLMLLIAGPDVVRFAPALIVSDEQIAEAGRLLRAAIDGMLKA